MIDWSDAEPDFIKPQNVVEIRTIGDAMKLLDQWQEAYAELRREHARLEFDYLKLHNLAECREILAREALRRA